MTKCFTTKWGVPVFGFPNLRGKDLLAFEIGCFEGRSTCWWFENVLVTPNCVLECVDPWDYHGHPAYAGVEMRFDQNTRELPIVKNKMSSYAWMVRQKEGSFDFGYIDGWHEGCQVLEDLVLAWRLIKPGGFLLCDDYTWQGKHVTHPPKPAIDAFVSLHSMDCAATHIKSQVKLEKSLEDYTYHLPQEPVVPASKVSNG